MKTFATFLLEKAPNDKEIEEWILKTKPIFKKEYPDNWEEVLYGKAWKMFNNKKKK